MHSRDRKWAWQPNNFWVRFARPWLNPPFKISKSATAGKCSCSVNCKSSCILGCKHSFLITQNGGVVSKCPSTVCFICMKVHKVYSSDDVKCIHSMAYFTANHRSWNEILQSGIPRNEHASVKGSGITHIAHLSPLQIFWEATERKGAVLIKLKNKEKNLIRTSSWIQR